MWCAKEGVSLSFFSFLFSFPLVSPAAAPVYLVGPGRQNLGMCILAGRAPEIERGGDQVRFTLISELPERQCQRPFECNAATVKAARADCSHSYDEMG